MFVREELPFRFVESQGFKEYLAALQPGFNTLSRITLARDILMLYETKKVQLQKYFSKYGGRVCLTTDNWSSCQNMAYMCLTVHFIDVDWKLQKKILNFCQVTGHTGEIMAQNVEACLNSWKLNKILSLTIDNASSNDDGLKEIDDSVAKIRDAVKYVRSSNSRLTRFKACIAQENIPHKSLVCIDVETRWNSTYLMLVAALKHQKVFELLEMQDKKFVEELNKGRGIPSIQDWDYAKSVLPFLEIFYDATLRISGSSYVTSNLYMKEVFALGRRIQQYRDYDDLSISLMASKMKAKYNKYWGNAKTINMLLLIAVVLDPCHKLDYVEWCLVNSFGAKVGGELKAKLSSCLHSLYNLYQGADEGNQDDTLSQPSPSDKAKDIYDMGLYRRSTGRKSNLKSELDRYLNENCEPNDKPLDILGWWKVNSNRFSILANMARDILAIPVSTVASESTFSMGEESSINIVDH
ncbi:zinc finger BED domain-containing protein RICESLEEPER 2-like [Arachis stenosperma]|uniref:zinc finger BED domain-containing protein RICESLEEPER 2-like n=1 Tax=Arachis stenosperma TaxID=217475 RepID=UPI0025AC144E|nr:zinc finger BED domain-containing protein RICESLEEPER 2-like [Arachis stenosperma]